MEPLPAPLDGTLLTLLDFVDFHAEHNPDRPWLVYPSPKSDGGLAAVTFKEMAVATHRIASELRPGKQELDNEVFAIVLHTDNVVYVAVMLGILRAGFVPFPISPRNSPQGICHLLQATACRRVLFNPPMTSLITQVNEAVTEKGITLQLEELAMLHVVLTDLTQGVLANATSFEPYPASRKPVSLDDPLVYLHSSGSTGLPKAVPFKHIQVVQSLRRNIFGSGRRKLRFGGMALPTFHSMGMLLQIFFPLCSLKPVAVYAPQYPKPPVVPSPASILDVCKLAKCEGLIATPSFIETWSHSPETVDYLQTLEVLIYGGGPLSVTIGDKMVSAGVPLYAGFGGSEFGNPLLSWDEVPPSDLRYSLDWSWFRFSKVPDIQMEPQGDETYELIVYDTDEFKVRVGNIPGKSGYATADLFERHPTRPDLWRIVGRKDDVITLSTGEKIVPLAQEGHIISSPLVSGCVMFGREREQAGILVEPSASHAIDPADSAALAEFRNKIWPVVDEANARAPAFARVFKEMIIVTDSARALPRSAKNTIIRKQATSLYVKEIDNLYSTIEQSRNDESIPPPKSWNEEVLVPWLLKCASSVASTQTIDPATNLFHQGFDSLSATFLRNRIIGALHSSDDPIMQAALKNVSSNFIFEHPAINDLAATLALFVVPATINGHTSTVDRLKVEVEALIARYTADIPPAKISNATPEAGMPVVLLTGSTGNIGSHILARLLSESRIQRVYALNRPSEIDAATRLKTAFTDRGLPAKLLEDPRLICIEGEVSRDHFGLDEQVYREVMRSITHIIHNAWMVNFNLSVETFENHIAGVRRLVDICASLDHRVKLLMTSSVGVARGWDSSKGPVPEQPLPELNFGACSGYAASKYVVEKILQAARERGLAATIVRMGQACGPKDTGAWGTTEWFPIMVKSSITLGRLPATSGPVSWVPLDAIGGAYVDWILDEALLPALVNVVHPQPTSWDVVLKGIREALGSDLPTTPYAEWLAGLELHADNATLQDLESLPALKILGFFRSLDSANRGLVEGVPDVEGPVSSAFDTADLRRSSPTMRELQPMSEEHARSWVRFWRAKGFIMAAKS